MIFVPLLLLPIWDEVWQMGRGLGTDAGGKGKLTTGCRGKLSCVLRGVPVGVLMETGG